MARYTDMGISAIDEVFTHVSPETGGMACHAGPHGQAAASVRRQREREELVSKFLMWSL